MSSMYVWPFAQDPLGLIPMVVNYDIVIQEPYPGICFYPTNAGSAYSEIREVNGCLWFVTNAMWNSNTLQWEQDSPCDPTLPAYAFEQCESGTWSRLVAPATGALGVAVAWKTTFALDQYGDETLSPVTLTAETQIASTVNVTWNAGGAALMVARALNVTDTSSAAGSALDQLAVGGVPVWEVRKDGTLVIGKIPASLIVGGIVQNLVAGTGISITPDGTDTFQISVSHGDYVDLPNAQTITGEKTFQGPVVLQALGQGSIGGNNNAWFANGAVFNGAAWVAEAATATLFILSSNGFSLYQNVGLTVGNTFAPTLIFKIDPTGKITTGAIDASQIQGDFEGAGGVVTSYDVGTDKIKIDGTALVETITSVDNSLTINRTGQSVDLKVASVGPIPGLVYSVNTTSNAGTGTLQFGAPLPGGAGTNYSLLCFGITSFQNQGQSCTLTGSGATWPDSPQTDGNGAGATTPLFMIGTATGGQTPAVAWSQGTFGAQGIHLVLMALPTN